MEYYDDRQNLNRKIFKLNKTLDQTTDDLRSMDQFVIGNRFEDNEEYCSHDMHEIHQALRDVTFGQNKIIHHLKEVQSQPNSANNPSTGIHKFKESDSLSLSPAMLKALEAPATKRIQTELERTQRSLAQQSATNAALNIRLNQNEMNLQSIDKTRAHLAAKVMELETKLDLNRAPLAERENLKFHNEQLLKEVEELRRELTQSVPLTKFETSQNQLIQSDADLAKLSEKMRQLKIELNEKDQQVLSLLKEMKDYQIKCDSLESDRDQLSTQNRHLDKEKKTLIAKNEANSEAFKQSSALAERSCQKQSEQMNELKEELDRSGKHCIQLELELENLHNAFNDETERTRLARIEEDRLNEELEETRVRVNNITNDFKHLLEERSHCDGLLTDIQRKSETYRVQVQEMEAKMFSWRKEAEKLQFELNSVNKNYESECSERCHLLEKLSSTESENLSMKEQNEQLQVTVNSQRDELAYLNSLKKKISTQNEEIVELKTNLEHQKKQLTKKLANLNNQYYDLDANSSKRIISLQTEVDTRKASYIELDARSRRQAEEIFRLNEELWRSQEHISLMNKRLDKRLLEAEQMRDLNSVSTSSAVDDGLVEKWSSYIKHIEAERNRVLRWMSSEVEAVINTMRETGIAIGPSPDTQSIPPAHLDLFEVNVEKWSGDMRAKMSWLRDAIRNLRAKLGDMKTNAKRMTKAQTERDKTERTLSSELSDLQVKFDSVNNQVREEKSISRQKLARLSEPRQDRNSKIIKEKCQRVQDTLDTVKYDLDCIERPLIPPIPKFRKSLSHTSLF